MAKKGRNDKDRCKTIEELRIAFNEITSVVAQDTWFMAKALMFLAEQAAPAPSVKKKREPSEWQKFFAVGMKAGKSPSQIAAEWKSRK